MSECAATVPVTAGSFMPCSILLETPKQLFMCNICLGGTLIMECFHVPSGRPHAREEAYMPHQDVYNLTKMKLFFTSLAA